jgi:hypothetical protein
VLHIKEPSLLKAGSEKHKSKFAALSPVMATVARYLKNSLCNSKQRKNKRQLRGIMFVNKLVNTHNEETLKYFNFIKNY